MIGGNARVDKIGERGKSTETIKEKIGIEYVTGVKKEKNNTFFVLSHSFILFQ